MKTLSFSTQTINIPYFNQIVTQTRPLNLSNQNTNTSYNNLMDTQHEKEEDCQCEDNKSIQPFQSNFARQLHENEVMRRNPLTTQNRIQRGIASNQRQLQQSQPTQHPIEYTQQQLQQALQPAALQDTQSKMELGYNPQQALTFNKKMLCSLSDTYLL